MIAQATAPHRSKPRGTNVHSSCLRAAPQRTCDNGNTILPNWQWQCIIAIEFKTWPGCHTNVQLRCLCTQRGPVCALGFAGECGPTKHFSLACEPQLATFRWPGRTSIGSCCSQWREVWDPGSETQLEAPSMSDQTTVTVHKFSIRKSRAVI